MSDFITLFGLAAVGLAAGQAASIWSCHLLEATSLVGLTRCVGCSTRLSLIHQMTSGLVAGRCPACGKPDRRWPILTSLAIAVLFVIFGWLLLSMQCQTVDEVRPSGSLASGRLPYHLLLLFLLAVCTITDMIEYVIPDVVVLGGAIVGVSLATLSGELQLIHIWVSWDTELVTLNGPYLPAWMDEHQHLHGLAWSLAGLVTGAGLTWLVRTLAGAILGYPAMGLGDVTLMAMIGAFLGWQPTLCALAIAPLTGVVLGLAVRLLTGRSYLAFGPYLACAAVIVLCSWRYLWQVRDLRMIFSHLPTVLQLVGGSLAVLCTLLGAVRMFRALPTNAMKR